MGPLQRYYFCQVGRKGTFWHFWANKHGLNRGTYKPLCQTNLKLLRTLSGSTPSVPPRFAYAARNRTAWPRCGGLKGPASTRTAAFWRSSAASLRARRVRIRPGSRSPGGLCRGARVEARAGRARCRFRPRASRRSPVANGRRRNGRLYARTCSARFRRLPGLEAKHSTLRCSASDQSCYPVLGRAQTYVYHDALHRAARSDLNVDHKLMSTNRSRTDDLSHARMRARTTHEQPFTEQCFRLQSTV